MKDVDVIQKRFVDFDEALEDAISNLLWDIPTDITREDVDAYIGPVRLDRVVKKRIEENIQERDDTL